MSMKIEVIDHTDEALEYLREQVQLGLGAIGEAMEGHAKEGCPIDTGRLRDSITYVTKTAQGSAGPKAQEGDASPRGTPEELEVQVGTNVKYAKYQEFGDNMSHRTGGAHFLRNAAANHADEYKTILETALQ